MRLAYRLGWLCFGIAGFFAPDWTSGKFADSMLNAWSTPAEPVRSSAATYPAPVKREQHP